MLAESQPNPLNADSTHFEPYPIFAPVYFASFIIIGSYILLNLVVGIIISSMEKASIKHEEELKRELDEVEKLQSKVLDDILQRLYTIESKIDSRNVN